MASGWALLPRIAGWFRPYRWLVGASLLLVIASAGVSMASPLLLQRVINVALPQHQTVLLGELCGGMIATGLLASLASVGQGALTNLIGQRVIHDLRVGVYDRVREMSLEFFTAEANTEIQARLVSDIGGLNDILTFTAQATVAAVVSLLTSCVVMFILSWPLALASVTLAVALNLANERFARRRRELARDRQEQVSELLRVVGEDLALPGVILGRTLGRCGWQRTRFAEVSRRVGELTYQQRLAGRTARALIGVAFACLPPAVYWLSGTVVPGLTLGTVVVVSMLQTRLSGPIQQLLSLSGTAQSSLAMFERVFAYLDLPPAVTLAAAGARPGRSDAPFLRVRGVSYSYQGSRQPVLREASLDLPPGTCTVIAGQTGSGKSTLALLLAGLLTPAGGVVEVGPEAADDARLRELVTLVPQESVLFSATIAENLRFGCPAASAADLDAAIDAAQLRELVTRLPAGLSTPVGERGYQLSGGERQRLALARALLAPHPVLILDEATSALDGPTAEAVHEALLGYGSERGYRARRTIVIVAHRIPRLRPHDRIVVVDAGRIVEHGAPGRLLAGSGRQS